MRERLPAYDIIDHRPDEAIVLVGPPSRITGALQLTNGGDEPAVVRRAQLVGDQRTASSGRIRTVKLAPGHSARAELRFQLPATTPPGEYQVEVEVAGARRAATVHVVEAPWVEASPVTVTVEAAPGETVTKHIALVNRGNIPTTVDALAAVALDDTLLQCRVLRHAAANFPNRENYDLGGLLREITEAGRDTLEHAGAARVRVRGGGRQVMPGETVSLALEIQAPPKLRHGSRYTGQLSVGSAVVALVIVPHLGPPDAGPETLPQPVPATTRPVPSAAPATTPRKRRPPRKAAPPKGANQ